MIFALSNTAAFFIAIFIQMYSSPLGGAWLFFLLLGCGGLLYRNNYPVHHPCLWWLVLIWMICVAVAAFLVRPVTNGAFFMWTLLAMPLVAISLKKHDLRAHIIGFGIVLTIYAMTLSAQKIGGFNLNPLYPGGRMSWPLLDPNNAAAMMNMAFTPVVWLALFKGRRYFPLAALFAFALYATGSRTGLGAAALGAVTILSWKYGAKAWLISILAGVVIAVAVFEFRPDIIVSAVDAVTIRFPIWWGGWHLMWREPLRGIGLGYFGHSIVAQGDTVYVMPAFAHNDPLQFAVEMGIPVGLVFIALVAGVVLHTRRENALSGLTLLVVFIQALMEFQLYLPCISIGMGLALACHIINRKERLTLTL